MVKKILIFLSILLLVFLIYNYKHLCYGLQQASGQYRVLSESVPLEEVLDDRSVPDSIKRKLEFIRAVKQFSIDHLKLNATDNYESYFDQKGEPILWMLTASPEFEIKAYQWHFPIAGSFSYKGFFDIEKAESEAQTLSSQGFDVDIDEVAAWSTLGWFSDPILSSMLERSEGKLVELIIHESTHATIYIKDDVNYNENLANYIGKKGAQLFLRKEFPEDTNLLLTYNQKIEKSALFRNYMLGAIQILDSLYHSLTDEMSLSEKRAIKVDMFNKIKWGLLEAGYFKDTIQAKNRLEKFKLNNAYFSGLSTYNAQYEKFDSIVNYQHQGSLKHFIDSLIHTHGSSYF